MLLDLLLYGLNSSLLFCLLKTAFKIKYFYNELVVIDITFRIWSLNDRFGSKYNVAEKVKTIFLPFLCISCKCYKVLEYLSN